MSYRNMDRWNAVVLRRKMTRCKSMASWTSKFMMHHMVMMAWVAMNLMMLFMLFMYSMVSTVP